MSLRTMFDRVVDLEVTGPVGEDARGNETRGTTTIEGVPAYRAQLSAQEDTSDRDQQARTFVYYVAPIFTDAADVEHDLTSELDGWDRIVDGNDTLEILGAPIVATSRGRARHVEARAFLVTG